jgi:hypothetical protein
MASLLLNCEVRFVVKKTANVGQKYRFGKQRVQHYFCSRCGSSLMAESIEPGFYEGVKAVNVSPNWNRGTVDWPT